MVCEFPALNEEFQTGEPDEGTTRTTFLINVPGTLVEGSGLGDGQEQLAKSEDFNFDAKSIMNQSIMRYNQFFQQKVSITIGGDFSLHAGDTVEFFTNHKGSLIRNHVVMMLTNIMEESMLSQRCVTT